MGRRATIQVTATKGELDPDLSERVDLEHYYDSLASAPNTIFHPQGGYSDRGGFALNSDADVLAAGTRRRLRRRIVPLPLTADNLTAANGGLTTNLADQDKTTLFVSNAVTANPFVLCEIDLGVATFVDLIDLIDFKSELAAADNVLAVQYWNATTWVTFADPTDTAPAKHIRTTARTRRFGTSPGGPGGARVAARQWRVVALAGAGSIGQVSIGGLRLWQEKAEISPIDVREVARDKENSYELVVTERNIDVFEKQRYVASIPFGVAAEQIDEMEYTGGYDTLLAFHEMIPTPRIVRQGSAGEWDVGQAPFTNVPVLGEQIVFSGDQDEIQDLTFSGLEAGDQVMLILGNSVAGPIVYATDAALPGQIATAMATFPGVSGGAALTVTLQAAGVVRVRFTGANGNRAWPLLTAVSPAIGAGCVSSVVQTGLKSDGYVFEDRTGWPRAGTFVQQRLCVGGFRAAPTSFMLSRPASWSFLTTGSPMTADLAILYTLNVDSVETISSIFMGRHLQIFTVSGEWYIDTRTYDATQPVGATRATSNGIRRAVPIAFADGGSLFVQTGGQTLRDFLWKDAEQSYGAEPLSVLSPQILTDVIDVAHRSARSVTEGNLVMLINADGTAGCLTLLRGQNVIAGSPWSTDGKFKAAMTSVRHEVYAVIERGGDHWLERWTKDTPLDFATSVAGTAMTTITGASHLDGHDDVWAIADGEVLGPFTVSGGAFALGREADSVTYGLLPPWTVRYQVLRNRINAEQPFRPPARIYEVEVSVRDTGHLTLGTNGRAHAEVPLVRLGDQFQHGGPLQTETGGAAGLPMFDRLYTGNVTMSGLIGFSKTPFLELGRTIPVPVHIKAARMELVMKSEL